MEKNLKELFGQYMMECEYSSGLRFETMRGYTAVFNLFQKIMPEILTLDDLSPAIMAEFFKRTAIRGRLVGKEIKSGLKASSIKTHWSKLNAFFQWVARRNSAFQNPLLTIRPPKVVYEDARRLEDKQLHQLYSAIANRSLNTLLLRRDTAMISTLLFTGIRKGECISLRVDDVDIPKKLITIRASTSKSGHGRVLPIHPTLLQHIKDYLKERTVMGHKTEMLWISTSGDKGLSRQGLKHWVNSLIRKSGVRFHLHMFRHTYACKLAESDVSMFKVQKLMGHTDVRMTAKYARSLNTESMGADISNISIS